MPNATVTFYSDSEDKYGSTIAYPNLEGKFKATVGWTVAVDPKYISYGTRLSIPAMAEFSKSGDGIFRAEDTGSDVVKRTASLRRGSVFLVFDFFAGHVDQATLSDLTEKFGPSVEYFIVS